jgi:hypothetical protein
VWTVECVWREETVLLAVPASWADTLEHTRFNTLTHPSSHRLQGSWVIRQSVGTTPVIIGRK